MECPALTLICFVPVNDQSPNDREVFIRYICCVCVLHSVLKVTSYKSIRYTDTHMDQKT